jgi:hypothetical protein
MISDVSRDKAKDKSRTMEAYGLAGTTSPPPPGVVEAGLESGIQAHIGRQLRHIYDEVVNEPVPDRFVKLLAALEARAAEPKPKGEA